MPISNPQVSRRMMLLVLESGIRIGRVDFVNASSAIGLRENEIDGVAGS